MIINGTYIPPESGLDKYENLSNLFDEVFNFHTNSLVSVHGDFNRLLLKWSRNAESKLLNFPSPKLIQIQSLLNSTIFHGLEQRNDKPNIMGRFLDLVFTNHAILQLTVPDDLLLPIDVLHPPLLIKFNVDCNVFSNNVHIVEPDISCYK